MLPTFLQTARLEGAMGMGFPSAERHDSKWQFVCFVTPCSINIRLLYNYISSDHASLPVTCLGWYHNRAVFNVIIANFPGECVWCMLVVFEMFFLNVLLFSIPQYFFVMLLKLVVKKNACPNIVVT